MACFYGWGQELAYNGPKKPDVAQAHQMAFEGDHTSAKDLLLKILSKTPDDIQARSLLASTFSWSGKYDEARKHFNKITSEERTDRDVWISAIKNELYAKEDATALGLANKALYYLKDDNYHYQNQQIMGFHLKYLNPIDDPLLYYNILL